MEGANEGDKQQEEDVLVARLMARIAELEERLYQQEFNQPTYGGPSQPVEPAAAQPKLGFLSAIKEGLRQLEESTGYTSTVPAGPPSPSQPPQLQLQPSQRTPRIVYYQTPPQEVVEQLQHNHGAPPLLQVESSQASGSSTATGAAADWISRLTLGSTVSARGTPTASVHNSGGGCTLTATHSDVHQYNGSVGGKRARGDDAHLQPGTSHSDTDSLSLPSTPLAPSMPSATQPRDATPTPSTNKNTTDWFSSFFSGKKDRPNTPSIDTAAGTGSRQSGETFSERTTEMPVHGSTQPDGSYLGHRYAFDPADIAAEMEVTARVRKAAAEALMAAEEKLRAAEQAQATLQQQLAQTQELSKEIESLRAENEAALRTRAALEDEMITARAQVEGMRQAQSALEQELDDMRKQAGIWQSGTSDEQEKLRAENQLLRSQMQTRLSELTTVRGRLTDIEAARQRLSKENDDLQSKIEWLTRINKQLESSAEQLEQSRKQAAEAQDKFMKERAVRRKLHEQLQQLRGNIRVMCRARPAQSEQPSIISYPLEGMLVISPLDKRTQEFEFDHVFGPEASQEAIYQEVSSLVRSCADGYNVCIFAYGQTGSGKTYTMEGPEDKPGINIRALQELFSIGAEEGIDLHWRVQVSMLEIHNDHVHDLMLPAGEVGARALEVSGLGAGELPPNTERVPGATWRQVASLEEVRQVLRDGSRNRATAATALNASSSRSHAVVSVRVTAHHKDMSLCSTLHLVDLAGSERVDKSEVAGQQLKEAQAINKSLSALGDVISALQRRTPHIPFRNSKLTQVLQDSLCGNSKVMLVCNISPEACSASETLSSLNFASRASQVELGPTKRSVTVADKQQAAADRAHPPPMPPPPTLTRVGNGPVLHSPFSKAAPGDKDRQPVLHSPFSKAAPGDKDRRSGDKETDKERYSPGGRVSGSAAGMRAVRSSQNLTGSQTLSKLGGNGSGDKGPTARAAH